MTKRVYFADLTHTGQVIAANIFPFGVSLIAARTKAQLGDWIDVDIFKYPDDLAAALEREKPAAVCFSHYLWNARLCATFAERIKAAWPDVPVVFGGPNYPVDAADQDRFMVENPAVDFIVVKEGEVAGAHLIEALLDHDFDAEALKASRDPLPSVHFRHGDETVRNELAPRLTDLTETPSPYLMGLLDKFFDDVLIPVIETNRGCPFGCSFCVEGIRYYNKVRWFQQDRTRAELEYIAARTNQPDLLISDSNFGMYKQDIETCKMIAALQKRTGWPKYVQNSSGKNQKERVVEAARILGGAMILTVSIQSADPVVLKNVNRDNISLGQIVDVGREAESLGANSYCEIILGLPGDSKDGHFNSVLSMIDAGINDVLSYQAMMLPGAEIASRASRALHGMKTRWRVLPRCFGEYDILGTEVSVAEIEEICVANDTLSFEDYLSCRALSLTVELFHNSGAFAELTALLGHFGLSASEFLRSVDTLANSDGSPMHGLYAAYLRENVEKLRDTRDAMLDYVEDPEIVAKHITGELGSGELYKARAKAHFWHQKELHALAFQAGRILLTGIGKYSPEMEEYLVALEKYSLLRKQELHDTGTTTILEAQYDFSALAAVEFRANPTAFRCEGVRRLRIAHTPSQQETIRTYLKQYGTSADGLGRLLLRAHVNKLYRMATPVDDFAPERAA